MPAYLLVIAERRGLAWILEHETMAFPLRTRQTAELQKGDELLLYSSRNCFHSPWYDRGRVMGRATVSGLVEAVNPPMEVAGILCGSRCPIKLRELAPYRTGVEVAPLVPKLKVFPDPASWSARLRTTLLPLPDQDVDLLRRRLESVSVKPAEAVSEYLRNAVGPRS